MSVTSAHHISPLPASNLEYVHGLASDHAPAPFSHNLGPLSSSFSSSHLPAASGPLSVTFCPPACTATLFDLILIFSHPSIIDSSFSIPSRCVGIHSRGLRPRHPSLQHVSAIIFSTTARPGSPAPPDNIRSNWSKSASAARAYRCLLPIPPISSAPHNNLRGTIHIPVALCIADALAISTFCMSSHVSTHALP